MTTLDNRVFLKDHYPELATEIREKYQANVDLVYFDPDTVKDDQLIPRLVRGMFEIGYATGQRDAAEGKIMPEFSAPSGGAESSDGACGQVSSETDGDPST